MRKRNIEQIFGGGGTKVLSLCLPLNTGASPEAECKNTRFPRTITEMAERGEGIE